MSDNVRGNMKPVKKLSVIDQVVSSIQDLITSKGLSVGSRLPSELDLCETLSVSRSTVREAYKILQTMGYVELKRGKGAFVRAEEPHDYATIKNWLEASASTVEEYTEVRGALESLAIKMAIKNGSSDEIRVLEEINIRFTEACSKHNVAELVKLDEQFHSQIVLMTRNRLLISLNDLVSAEFKKYREMSLSLEKNAKSAVGPHQGIVEALKNRDVSKGIDAVLNHLHLVVTDMHAVIDDKSEDRR